MALQAVQPADDSRKRYELYVSYCKKFGYKTKTFEAWKAETVQKEEYEKYLKECETEGKNPKTFLAFKKDIKKSANGTDQETDELTFAEYLIEFGPAVTDEELEPDKQQHATHRPIRMYDALTVLNRDPDLTYENGYGQEARFKESVISYCAVNHGFSLMSLNETMARIVKINELLGDELEDDEALDAIRTQRFKNNTKQSRRGTHFYCGTDIKGYIGKHSDPLGLDQGDIAQYLWLLGITDHEFNPKIKNSLLKTLEELNNYLEDRLTLFERFAERKGIDLSDIE